MLHWLSEIKSYWDSWSISRSWFNLVLPSDSRYLIVCTSLMPFRLSNSLRISVIKLSTKTMHRHLVGNKNIYYQTQRRQLHTSHVWPCQSTCPYIHSIQLQNFHPTHETLQIKSIWKPSAPHHHLIWPQSVLLLEMWTLCAFPPSQMRNLLQ